MKPRILNTARLSFPLATAIAALLSAQSARAADGTWLGTSGDWNAPGTWSGGAIAAGSGSTANFTGVDITADQTINLSAPQTIGNITFTDATTDSHNLIISGANILTLEGTPEINVTQGSRTLTISSQVAGDDGLTKVGPGTLSLTGANTYSGVSTISAGRLNLGNSAALGSSSGITIGGASAATLSASVSGIIIGVPITTANTGVSSTIASGLPSNSSVFTLNGAIGGDGNVIFSTIGNHNPTINLGAASTYAGSTTITHASSYNSNTVKNTSGAANALPSTTVLSFSVSKGEGSGRGTTFDLNGQNQTLAGLSYTAALPSKRSLAVTSVSAATLTINNTADFSFGAANGTRQAQITGAIALTKDGAGTFTLGGTLSGGATSNDHNYTGATNILGGTLSISESGTINSTSGVTIGAGEFNYNSSTALTPGISFSGTGGTLSGTGTISQAVSVTTGNTLAIGNSVGQMNFGNTLGLGGNTLMEIDGTLGAGLTGGHDFANVTGALTYGGALILDLGATFGTGTYSWNLFDFAGADLGTFSTITLSDKYSGNLLDGDSNGIWDLNSGSNTWQFTESTGVLGLTVIPEPRAALLGGLGLLALLRRRRA